MAGLAATDGWPRLARFYILSYSPAGPLYFGSGWLARLRMRKPLKKFGRDVALPNHWAAWRLWQDQVSPGACLQAHLLFRALMASSKAL